MFSDSETSRVNAAPLSPDERIAELCVGGVEVYVRPGFLDGDAAEELFRALAPGGAAGVEWVRRQVHVYGWRGARRKTAFFGDSGTSYRYSGRDNPCTPWPDEAERASLVGVKQALGSVLAPLADGREPNFCLLNYYEKGTECIGKHADDEKDLVLPIIASISLGSDRPLRFSRPMAESYDVRQPAGTLVVMAGRCQQVFKHEVPPTKKEIGPRVNLTFRYV